MNNKTPFICVQHVSLHHFNHVYILILKETYSASSCSSAIYMTVVELKFLSKYYISLISPVTSNRGSNLANCAVSCSYTHWRWAAEWPDGFLVVEQGDNLAGGRVHHLHGRASIQDIRSRSGCFVSGIERKKYREWILSGRIRVLFQRSDPDPGNLNSDQQPCSFRVTNK